MQYLVYLFSAEFSLSLYFFRTCFHFVFCFYLLCFFFQEWRMTWVASSDCMTDYVKTGPFKNSGDLNITKSLKFCFSLFCRVLLLSVFFFFFVPVFILCLFRGDELHNYFTSIIGLYNGLLSKIGSFKSSGKLSITNSLKLGFSVFFKVLLLAFFFRTCFDFVFFWFRLFFLQLLAI